MSRKTVFYTDELNEDFAGTNIDRKPLREDYRYVRKEPLWRAAEFLLYRVIAQPLVWLFVKAVFLQRFQNKRVLKAAKNSGAYLYANHTNGLFDAFVPNMLDMRKRCWIIVGPDAMSIPGLNPVIEMLGGVPLGSTAKQKLEMRSCVAQRVGEKGLVTIYPEAHIWPWYTGIRPFSAASFVYPAHDGLPVYAVTNCYQKRRIGRFPKLLTFVDGPFYADLSLPIKERRERLRNQCYEAMQARASEHSTYAYWNYVASGR